MSYKVLTVALLIVHQISSASIIPGAYWTDNNGVPIQAHGGGILKFGGAFYWYGEDKTPGRNFPYVNVYKSNDLVSWTNLGRALPNQQKGDLGPNSVVERPKVIYNEGTKTFVMWFHLDSSNYGLAKLGVATSKNVQGPFTFVNSIRPYNEDSRDMTVWVDTDDKSAYLIYATRVNLDTVITKLTPDYLNLIPKSLIKFTGIHREGYSVFKNKGMFYLITSGATGWDPNPNTYMFSKSMASGWSTQFPLAPSSKNTFNSQSNFVIPVGGQFIYCGDQWNKNALGNSRYVWLPIKFDANNQIHIDWMDQWSIDTNTGNSGSLSSRTFKADVPAATLTGGAKTQACSGCMNRKSVGFVGRGGRILFKNIPASRASVYSIVVSYASGNAANRQASVNVNGKFVETLTFYSTNNANNVAQLVFQAPLLAGNNNSIEFYNDKDFAPDFDYIKV